ncbi:hypothetical protein [Mangrovimonas sp. DI 80]|uniref:hypothetical protein n=1 Tax=Mangrovimonas sp. DI 80 TaxID=1779330 RepID=UPI00097737C0|nr:hypothetical protein [Mangrovimonas sp. DI 80]OMP30209.1 hypothetical protein BKM32_12560 [Mangrovimonas sp. DI 80]
MNKLLRPLAIVISIITLALVIIALTDVWPNNPFIKYKFLIVIFSIAYNRSLIKAYKNRN